MSIAELPPAKLNVIWKGVRKAIKRLLPLVLAAVFIPKVLAAYLACGLIDVLRNSRPNLDLLQRYFVGNGLLTWLLSPFNLLMDLLTIPYWNKGVYQLNDLPPSYREEIKSVIDAADKSNLVEQLQTRIDSQDRVMVFFKWYGKNIEAAIDVPEFHRRYKHIRTIGVSVFNKRQSTSEHFGPLRVTLRMLYNLNTIEDRNAYIQVGGYTHRWCNNKLLIFDDTLQHESRNETDVVRYCMFIDILRPSLIPGIMNAILRGLRVLLQRVNCVFYRNWTFIK
jgi:beta-hydroxylase